MTRWGIERSTLISSPASNCCELPFPHQVAIKPFLPPYILKVCPFAPFLVAPTLMTPREDLSFDSVSDKEAERRRWVGGWKIWTDERGKEGCAVHGLLRGSEEKACPRERKEEEVREVKMREKRGGKSKIKKKRMGGEWGDHHFPFFQTSHPPLMTPVRVRISRYNFLA